MTILTGIDLPLDAPGGSMELLKDLYLGGKPLIDATVLTLAASHRAVSHRSLHTLNVPIDRKAVSGNAFSEYVRLLAREIKRSGLGRFDGLHLQHVAFGCSSALLQSFPSTPAIALVHGTDVIYAEQHLTQRSNLQSICHRARKIVVPTSAMADKVAQLCPEVREKCVVRPWGVPDDIIDESYAPHSEVLTVPNAHDGILRILYAGRLTTEKIDPGFLRALAQERSIALSVAAPTYEFAALFSLEERNAINYLGWLDRRELWREFRHHDLLVVPSTKLEAFGLVAVEAQACGLPVAFAPVPGLEEVAQGGLPILGGTTQACLTELLALRDNREVLRQARLDGLRNAAQYRLSGFASALQALGAEVF